MKVWYIILMKLKNKIILMNKLLICILVTCFFYTSNTSATENFFKSAKNKYYEKKLEESKFLFQRNIVYNPKDSKSYLYLAKIYNQEKNEKEELKNLKTSLLLQPNSEEALFMLIDIKLKKSNFSEVKELLENFKLICLTLCDQGEIIKERLINIEAKNESKE